MTLKMGERSVANVEIECSTCTARVLINEGQEVPRCPVCWGEVFQKRRTVANRMTFLWQTAGSSHSATTKPN